MNIWIKKNHKSQVYEACASYEEQSRKCNRKVKSQKIKLIRDLDKQIKKAEGELQLIRSSGDSTIAEILKYGRYFNEKGHTLD